MKKNSRESNGPPAEFNAKRQVYYLVFFLKILIVISIFLRCYCLTRMTQNLQGQSNKSISGRYNLREDSREGFHIEPPPVNYKNGITHSNSVIHPNVANYEWSHKVKDVGGQTVHRQTFGASHHGGELLRHGSQKTQLVKELSSTLRDHDTGVSL